MQAVGDGAQGWCNAILYILLSPTIRQRLILDPCNKCLNITIEKASLLLESDTRSHTTTDHSERSKVIQRNTPTDCKYLRGSTKYGSTGTSDTTYHSLASDEYSVSEEPLPPIHPGVERRSHSVQSRTTPVPSVAQGAAVTRDTPRVEKFSSTYTYVSASEGESTPVPETPDS